MTDSIDEVPFETGSGDGLRLGVRRRPRTVPVCVCGDIAEYHIALTGQCCGPPPAERDSGAEECLCTKFQAKPKSSRRKAIRRNAKKAETEVAEMLGGRRVPAGVAAQQRQGDIDVTGEWFGVQVKHRPWPTWLREALEQAEVGVLGSGKMALVALKDKPRAKAGGNKPARILIAMDIRDFVDLHGKGNKNAEED